MLARLQERTLVEAVCGPQVSVNATIMTDGSSVLSLLLSKWSELLHNNSVIYILYSKGSDTWLYKPFLPFPPLSKAFHLTRKRVNCTSELTVQSLKQLFTVTIKCFIFAVLDVS